MAVTLRLARRGQKKRAFYRIVATERLERRDGGFIEILGHYNPMTDPPTVFLKEDRIKRWIEVGAQTTAIVRNMIVRNIPGLIEAREEHQRSKIQDRRRRRKARQSELAAK